MNSCIDKEKRQAKLSNWGHVILFEETVSRKFYINLNGTEIKAWNAESFRKKRSSSLFTYVYEIRKRKGWRQFFKVEFSNFFVAVCIIFASSFKGKIVLREKSLGYWPGYWLRNVHDWSITVRLLPIYKIINVDHIHIQRVVWLFYFYSKTWQVVANLELESAEKEEYCYTARVTCRYVFHP